MSFNYAPDQGVFPVPPYSTAFLSQRDLGLQVPIDFVTAPGVSISRACFAHHIYEDQNAAKCLSNLLAMGFQRLEVDLFWDEERSLWTLCPVSVSSSVSSTSALLTSRIASSSTSNPRPSSTSLSALVSDFAPTGKLSARQATTAPSIYPSNITRSSPSTGAASSLGSILPSFIALPDSTNEVLIRLGPYSCTTTINLSSVLSQLLDYVQQTETTLAAHLLYLIINLHAAASQSSPTLPAVAPTRMPASSNLLGSLVTGNLSTYLYTPDNLHSNRANLNNSWYTVSERYRPTSDYYSTSIDINNVFSTESGWPSESYVEFALGKRLLLQWGTIDPQMANYNFSADNGVIFPNGFIQENQDNIATNAEGDITRGCYFVKNSANLSTSSINSSWATVATVPGFDYTTASPADLIPILSLTSNLTSCGISTLLNVTLLNSTADQNFSPYSNFSYASMMWSWAPNEPKNSSSGTEDTLFSCATSNLALGGRWTVKDCSQKYYAACRAEGRPYNWTFTSYQISYSFASDACPDSYLFSAPRNSLENSYLTQAMRASQIDFEGNGIWVDFNSLDVKGCWVTGGPLATCPYVLANDPLAKQNILVPTIAAIIVLVVTALTVFVKIAGYRKVRKRTRKRVKDGFVYEGVPS